MPVVQTRLDVETDRRLTLEASSRDATRSDVVRLALDHFFHDTVGYHVEIVEQLGQPPTARIHRDGVLVFDGVGWAAVADPGGSFS